MPVTVRCPKPTCAQLLQLADATGTVSCPHCGQAFRLAAPASKTLDLPPGDTTTPNAAATRSLEPETPPTAPLPTPAMTERLGRFAVRRFLGEGAFGRVYEAYDPQLDRAIALKVAKPELLQSERRVARFLREAKSAANLRHPHIVPVYDSGSDGGHFYIASAFIPGRSLDRHLEELPPGQVRDFRTTAQVVRRLAEALGYAHQRKVIHRDVKPANVMLDEQGEPLLMDFGLAAREEGGEKLTQEGTKGMGTPAYMAPEQGAGEAVPASDQYSLGCTLYEMLTGQTPFAGPPELQMFLHQSQEPKSPRSLNGKVPLDLDTICLKCLEKEPAKRYADCQALADDLRRWLDGEPITARRMTMGERVWRWCKKEPMLAATGVVAVAALFAVAVITTVNAKVQASLRIYAEGETKTAEAAKALANENEGKARKAAEDAIKAERRERFHRLEKESGLYVADMHLAYQTQEKGQTIETLKLLHDHGPKGNDLSNQRGFDWYYLLRLCQSQQRSLNLSAGKPVGTLAFAPDGKSLLLGTPTITLWDVATGQAGTTFRLDAQRRGAAVVAFTPDGKTLLASHSSGVGVAWWDVATGQLQGRIKGLDSTGIVVFAPDGETMAVAKLREVEIWKRTDGATRPERRLVYKGPNWPTLAAFSRDGKRLAASNDRGDVQIWDLESGNTVTSFTIPERRTGQTIWIRVLAFSPDGRSLAAGTDKNGSGEVFVADAGSGKPEGSFGGAKLPIISLAFSPDSKLLAAGSGDPIVPDRKEASTIQLWDTTAKQVRGSLQGHTGRVKALAFSPDGTTLVSGSGDGTVRLWDVGDDPERDLLKGHKSALTSLAFSPEGSLFASAGGSGVRLWDASTGQERHELRGHAAVVTCLGFAPGGKRLATGSRDGTVRLWDTSDGSEQKTLTAGGGVSFVQFSPDGRWLVALESAPNEARRLHARVWDATTGAEVAALTEPLRTVNAVGFRPDGKLLASSEYLRKVSLIDVAANEVKPLHEWRRNLPLSGILSPDGKTLATVGYRDGIVRLWDAETWEERRILSGHAGLVHSLTFSADSKVLAVAAGQSGQPGEVKLWDVVTGRERPAVAKVANGVSHVAFAPDNRTLATNWDLYTVRLWRGSRTDDVPVPQVVVEEKVPPPGVDPPVVPQRPPFEGHTERVKSVAFSPDGKRLVTGSWDKTARVWDVATGQEIHTNKDYTDYVHCVAFSPDGQRVVTGSGANFKPNELKIWDAATGQPLQTLKGHTGRIHSVAYSPDGKRLVSAGEGGERNQGGEVKVWDAATGQELASFKGHRLEVFSARFSPDGKRIVSGSRDPTVKVWDAQTGETQLTLVGHMPAIFSPDGQRILSGNASDHSVKVWDATSGKLQVMLKGHTGPLVGLAYSTDGKRILSASSDRTIRVWDATSGQEVEKLNSPSSGSIHSVDFSTDGQRVVSGSGDHGTPGGVKVWELSRTP